MINPSSLDLATLPSLLLSERAKLPETPGVCFAINSLGQIQYIGRSINIRNRWLSHHRKPDLKIIDNIRIAWIEIEELTLLGKIEQELIDYFVPRLNGLRNRADHRKSETDDALKAETVTRTPQTFIPLEYVAHLAWNKILGERLELLRGEVSRRELAERLKRRGIISCSHQKIRQIELGEWKTVHIDFLIAVCEELGHSLDKLTPVLTISPRV
jgi:excinuclease UvrABC nuclease subunit